VVNRLCSPAVSRRALVGFAAGAAGTASALVAALGHRVPAVLPGRGVTLPIAAGVDRDATARSILMLGAAVR
jgi:hypothetical protein